MQAFHAYTLVYSINGSEGNSERLGESHVFPPSCPMIPMCV